MAEYLIQDTTLTNIANAVRSKTEKTDAILVSDIANEILNISTGVELNFKVVGGTTEPSNPVENMIWVNTSTSITSWSFIHAQTPTWTSTSGDVAILSKTASSTSGIDFNMLIDNNSILIEPMAVYQYVDDAWIYKTAKIYQSGEWVDFWDGVLYYHGTKDPIYTDSLNIVNGASYTEGDSSVTFGTGSSDSEGITIEKVDFTRFSKLYINITSASFNYANNSANVTAFISVSDVDTGETVITDYIVKDGKQYTGKKTFEVSGLSGYYDINLRTYTYVAHDCYINVTFNELYLEA